MYSLSKLLVLTETLKNKCLGLVHSSLDPTSTALRHAGAKKTLVIDGVGLG